MITQVGRDQLVHLGCCVGKLTHSGKFRLTIGALSVLAQFAKHKVRACVSFALVCLLRVCVFCARVRVRVRVRACAAPEDDETAQSRRIHRDG